MSKKFLHTLVLSLCYIGVAKGTPIKCQQNFDRCVNNGNDCSQLSTPDAQSFCNAQRGTYGSHRCLVGVRKIEACENFEPQKK